jgi:hypothetical protein
VSDIYELELRAFLADVMQPNVADALKNPNDHRSNFNACASVEAAASAIYWILVEKGVLGEKPIKDGKYKELLSAKNENFRIVHDAAEAQKHRKLTYAGSAGRSVQNASDLQSAPHGLDCSLVDEMMFDVGEAISVTVDGQLRAVASNLAHAASFIEGEVFLAEGNSSSILA